MLLSVLSLIGTDSQYSQQWQVVSLKTDLMKNSLTGAAVQLLHLYQAYSGRVTCLCEMYFVPVLIFVLKHTHTKIYPVTPDSSPIKFNGKTLIDFNGS